MQRAKAQPATHRYNAMKHQAVSRCHGNFAIDFRGTMTWPSKSTTAAPLGALPTIIT